jgi:hypothetical protein
MDINTLEQNAVMQSGDLLQAMMTWIVEQAIVFEVPTSTTRTAITTRWMHNQKSARKRARKYVNMSAS